MILTPPAPDTVVLLMAFMSEDGSWYQYPKGAKGAKGANGATAPWQPVSQRGLSHLTHDVYLRRDDCSYWAYIHQQWHGPFAQCTHAILAGRLLV